MKTAADNYSIYRFMTRDLGLRGAELLVFALIYSFTVTVGEFSGSRAYVAETVGVSERTVDRAMRELTAKGLIERGQRQENLLLYQYTLVPKRAIAAIKSLGG